MITGCSECFYYRMRMILYSISKPIEFATFSPSYLVAEKYMFYKIHWWYQLMSSIIPSKYLRWPDAFLIALAVTTPHKSVLSRFFSFTSAAMT